MGIDIGFTDENFVNCKYALCRSYRNRIIAFQNRIDRYKKALKTADKHALETQMSY